MLDPGRAREPDHDGQRRRIQAKVVVEGANGPTTPDGRDPATSVASSSSRTSSPTRAASTPYFEWVQDRYGYFWSEKEVNERLESKMCEAFDAVLQTSIRYA